MGLSNRIDALKTRHQQLDENLKAESTKMCRDELEIHSLKKEKLRIKDELNNLTRH